MNLTQGETILLALLLILWLQCALGTYSSFKRWSPKLTLTGKTIVFFACIFTWPWILSSNIMDIANQVPKILRNKH